MITLNSCPVCKSGGIRPYPETGFAPYVTHDIMPGVLVDAAVITRYFVCQNCHVIFQNPRFSDTELDKFYSKGYYRKTLNLTDKEMDDDEKQRAKTDAEIISKHVGEISSHLDIGCSRGYLLDAIGANTRVGVEPNVSDMRIKGTELYSAMNLAPQKLYDLVTAIHTLEHVPDPLKFLLDMVVFLDDNGYLVIEVPTWKSPGGPLRLAHLFHFQPDVLRLLCKRVGLRITHTEFTPHLLLICKKERG